MASTLGSIVAFGAEMAYAAGSKVVSTANNSSH